MSDYVKKGILYEFEELGCGMVLEILSSREPVLGNQLITEREFLCKAAYVVDALVGDDVCRLNVSVHWYHPDGAPTGWWSWEDPQSRVVGKSGWHSVNWL